MNFLPGEGLRPLILHNHEYSISNFGRVFNKTGLIPEVRGKRIEVFIRNQSGTYGYNYTISELMQTYWKELTDVTVFDENLAEWVRVNKQSVNPT